VFSSLVHSNLAGEEIARIAAFTVVVTAMMGLLGWLSARAFRLDARATAGMILVCMFVNSGNYGLGVNQRVFGDQGLARATIYFTTSTLLVYSLGVAVAAGSNGGGVRATIRHVFEVPPMYAAVAALLVRALSIDVTQPALEPVMAGIDIASRAAIPAMLVILGMQLARTVLTEHAGPVLTASGISLIAAPIVAWIVAALIGLTGVARQTSIIEASMPAAVINIILATEYRAAPELVTSSVLLSTVLSPITLTLILSLLK
jgi:predicted permease